MRQLVVTAPMVVDLLDVSPPAARGAIATLADRGILAPMAVPHARARRPPRWWMAPDLVALVSLA